MGHKYTTTGEGMRIKAKKQQSWTVRQRVMRQEEARRLAWTVRHQADEPEPHLTCPCASCTCGDPSAGKGI